MKKISVIAPANSIVSEKDRNLLDIGRQKLVSKGFLVNYEKNIFSNKLYDYSGTIEEKQQDLQTAFSGECDIVLCATGGINSNCLLEYIDTKCIENNANKKIFIGNSNNTVLLNYLNEKFGVKCFLGPNLKSLGKYESELSLRNFESKLLNGSSELLFSSLPVVVSKGKCTGKTFGGNGSALRRMFGTKYFPNFKDKILVLEFSSKENSPIEVLSILSQLKQIGVFENIVGLLLGEYSNEISIKELIYNYTFDKKYPIIITNDFGHNCESTFIPIGTYINIDTDNNIYMEVTKNDC